MWGAISLSSSSHFPADAVFERGEPGGVAARLRQARDEPCADRIDDIREHDRRAAACLLQRGHACAGRGQNDVRRKSNQFSRVCAIAVRIARRPASVDPHVAAIGPAQLL